MGFRIEVKAGHVPEVGDVVRRHPVEHYSTAPPENLLVLAAHSDALTVAPVDDLAQRTTVKDDEVFRYWKPSRKVRRQALKGSSDHDVWTAPIIDAWNAWRVGELDKRMAARSRYNP